MREFLNQAFELLASRYVVRNCLGMLIVSAFLVAFIFFSLRLYTRHGSKAITGTYTGRDLQVAREEIEEDGFEPFVTDSIFVVETPGGKVLEQTPKPGLEVKPGRKIYLTVSKYEPDKFSTGLLPDLYGKNFSSVERMLAQAYQIKCKVTDFRYDEGPANHVLEVRYQGRVLADRNHMDPDLLIEKGCTLEFVLSEEQSGEVAFPDLDCMTQAEAEFLLTSIGLALEDPQIQGSSAGPERMFVLGVDPPVSKGATVRRGQAFSLILSPEKPASCP